MSNTLSQVKRALQRKLGLLPAWAWALIAGAAIYVYRARRGDYSTQATSTPTDSSGSSGSADASSGADPLTLDPGQSVYDPNTGQLQGTAPEQQPQLDPVTLDPGQTVYDPNTGQIEPGSTGTTKRVTKKKSKRKPKAKTHHKQHKSVKHPTHAKRKPRTLAKVLRPKGRLKAIKTGGSGYIPPKARARGRATVNPSGAPRARADRSFTAIRQRPAAPHVTHPVTQRIAPHPAHAPAPVGHPHSPVHQSPAIHRRRRKK